LLSTIVRNSMFNFIASTDESLSKRRIAVHILCQFSSIIEDANFYYTTLYSKIIQYFHDVNYDLRRIVCSYAGNFFQMLEKLNSTSSSTNEELMKLLQYVTFLVEDDDSTVKC
jgi:hypothetical protein